VYVDQYDMSGGGQAPGYTLTIPSAGASALTLSGSASTEGALSRSADGLYLTFAGYNADAGTANVKNVADVARGAALVDSTGGFSLAAKSTSPYASDNIRSAATSNGSAFWLGGTGTSAGGGVWELTASSATQVYNAQLNTRVVNIIAGDLYYSTGAGTGTRGIHKFNGLPTAAGATATQLFDAGANASPNDFAISPGGQTVYLADDRSIANGGGIQRWDYDAGQSKWTLSDTLGTGAGSTVGARGLAVDFSGPTTLVFATTGEASANRLIRIEDTGSGATAFTLATAPVNTVLRGVDFSPVPEPRGWTLLGVGSAALLLVSRRHNRRG